MIFRRQLFVSAPVVDAALDAGTATAGDQQQPNRTHHVVPEGPVEIALILTHQP